jgi:DNA-directed RNA polymerase specialized sigma24 family protein
LSPPDLPLSQPGDESADSPKGRPRRNWTLTKESLDKLLACFSPDREEAGKQFEMMRTKLLRYLEWRSSPSPERDVDETVNRVARRIHEGKQIVNLSAYFLKVAQIVCYESQRAHKWVPLDDLKEMPYEPPVVDEQKKARLLCLDECLDKQSAANRRLIVEYYFDVKRAKIDHRRQLAEDLSINALRIRTCRIRKSLEKCVKDCMKRSA